MLESVEKAVGKIITRGVVLCAVVVGALYLWYKVSEDLQDEHYAR